MLFYTRRCVGIAIGQHTTHIVELIKRRRQIEIALTAAIKTFSNKPQRIEPLQYCLSHQAVVSIPKEFYVEKSFVLRDSLTDIQIEQDCLENLRRYFPQYECGDFFDFTRSKNQTLQIVLAKKNLIRPILKSIEQYGMAVRHIRIETANISQKNLLSEELNHAYALGLQGLA